MFQCNGIDFAERKFYLDSGSDYDTISARSLTKKEQKTQKIKIIYIYMPNM